MNEENKKEITSEIFLNLYQRTSKDEEIVKISDAPGITILRKYDENTKYFNDGKKILIKFYLSNGYISGSIDMVHKNEDGSFTSFDSSKPYKSHFTNFFFNKSENIIFDEINQKIIIKRKNKKLSVNDFVELLIKNHLADRLFWKRKINKLKVYFLSFIFCLTGQRYDWLSYYHKIRDGDRKLYANQINKSDTDLPDILEIDPFFRYFKIFRKILFIYIIFITIMLFYLFYQVNIENCYLNGFNSLFKIENLSIANPLLLFPFFISLFILHYLSSYLKKIINKKDGFIHKLHESSLNYSFTMKI